MAALPFKVWTELVKFLLAKNSLEVFLLYFSIGEPNNDDIGVTANEIVVKIDRMNWVMDNPMASFFETLNR
ncbi:hypothetical protein WICPIJ_003351 [Wickerhamomyces pijperi]|uniref:Uncharacterized protein n=1 Tax=Wickerhamomyces pijperi TaxID=599730 RepID=A0A9P8Q797_WICPI|nr:hypothetical protein WICPIJ_003351 [Wickerhamomyces pijperi]